MGEHQFPGTPDPFEGATYYDCVDSEHLTCETPVEAIEEYFDVFASMEASIAADIEEACPIEVVAYRKLEVSEEWITSMIDGFVDVLEDGFSEDFGNPDGAPDDEAVSVEAREALLNATRLAVRSMRVWACERVGKRSYSVEEVTEILRREHPYWFEKEGAQ